MQRPFRGHTRRPSFPVASLALLVTLLVACGGAGATALPTGIPTSPGSQATGILASNDPGPTAGRTAGPLPAPDLTSIDAIVTALTDAAIPDRAVVSMLDQLGIGVYEPDGTMIRSGSEISDEDLFLFEPEVQGLVRLLVDREAPEQQITFRDFHAGLVGLGFTGSAEDLAAAYRDAYAAAPEAAISRYVAALTEIDVDGAIPGFAMWLLVLDGFVPPNRAATATAAAGTPLSPIAAGQAGWGTARSRVQASGSGLTRQQAQFIARLAAIAASWSVDARASAPRVHEGHGVPGSPITLTASVSAGARIFTSPMTGRPVIPVDFGSTPVHGVHIAWRVDAQATPRGTLNQATTAVDSQGNATAIFTPNAEAANGQGTIYVEPSGATASIAKAELLERFYGRWAMPYATLIRGLVEGSVGFLVEFHKVAEPQIKIVWTDVYDNDPDTFTFEGKLEGYDAAASANGQKVYMGKGTVSGSRFAWAACNPGIEDVPSGTVKATFIAGVNVDGTITIAAYADVETSLAGVSSASITVPIDGGQAQAIPQGPFGEICPHRSFGTLTYEGGLPPDVPLPAPT